MQTTQPIASSVDKSEQRKALCQLFRNSLYHLKHDDGTRLASV